MTGAGTPACLPSALPRPNLEQLLHHMAQLAAPGGHAEGVVQGAVEVIELAIHRHVFGDRVIHLLTDGGDFVLQFLPGACTGGRSTEDGGAEGASLLALANFHRLADDVGVDLHERGIFDGEAAGVDDFLDLHAVFLDTLDDGERTERRRLDVGAVDLVRLGVQRLAEQQAGEAHIDEDGAIAVVPIEREQARGTGFLAFHGLFHGHELLAHGFAVAVGHEVIHQPQEEIAHGALAGLDAIVAGQDAAIHDAADAGNVRERFARG